MGCWKDTSNRAIQPLEGLDPVLDGHYRTRSNAVEKCAGAAKKRGYKIFAIQNGGWCASSQDGEFTYNKYGVSYGCRGDGKGGSWSNRVYQFNSHSGKSHLLALKIFRIEFFAFIKFN